MAKKSERQKVVNNITKEVRKYWNNKNWSRARGEEYLKAAKIIAAKDAASWAKAFSIRVH